MSTLDYPAIDVHAHYGNYNVTDAHPHLAWCMTGDANVVVARAKACNVQLTIASPTLALFPRGKADAVAGNIEAAMIVPQTPGLLQYVVVHPLQPETFKQADEMLKQPTCVGIKLHPEEHTYPITVHGHKLFELAAKHKATVLVHSGEARSFPDDFIPFADAFPEVRLILAHIGCSSTGDRTLQCRAIQKSKKGNVYTDSSSMWSIMPRNIEWTAQQVGVDRVLFGTDTPLYFTAMQRARIDFAEGLSDADKRAILRDNALRVFGDKLTSLAR